MWDYLRSNLEAAISVSQDGHKWSTAVENVETCDSRGASEIELKLLKSICLIDLFKDRSPISAKKEILETCISLNDQSEFDNAIKKLSDWSKIIYREYLQTYAIFEGSDFDIDASVSKALDDIDQIDFKKLIELASPQPILAKRHYHDYGSLRWFEVNICPLSEISSNIESFQAKIDVLGCYLLVIPTQEEDIEAAKKVCAQASDIENQNEIIIGLSLDSWEIVDIAKELLALENVYNSSIELQGDRIARREVITRINDFQSKLESKLSVTFNTALWFQDGKALQNLNQSDLSKLASDIADKKFSASPKISNELVNRVKPSGTANGAKNNLLKKMIKNVEKKGLVWKDTLLRQVFLNHWLKVLDFMFSLKIVGILEVQKNLVKKKININ